MAKAKKEDKEQVFSFDVKSGDQVSKYDFRRSAFNDPQRGRIEVKEMFDDKGALKGDYEETVANLVKMKSGVIAKQK